MPVNDRAVLPLAHALMRPLTERVLALAADGRPVTDRGFVEEALRWCAAGEAHVRRIPPRSRPTRALLHAEDAAQFLPALFGLWSAGIEVCLTGDTLAGTLERLRAGGMVEAGDLLALDWAQAPADARRMTALDGGPVEFPEPDDALRTRIRRTPLPESQPLLTLFTSGTTGDPERVPKLLGEVFAEAESLSEALHEVGVADDAPFWVSGTVTPQHIYGLLFRALWPLTTRRAVVDGRRLHFEEEAAQRLAEAKRSDVRMLFVSSPSQLSRLSDAGAFAPNLDALLGATSSAGPLSDEGALAARRALGSFPLEILGSTETGGMARRRRRLTPEGVLETPDWRPMPDTEIRVRLESGELARSGAGRIAIRSNHIAREDWLVGSDRIELSEEGFRLLGRADRVVKIEGKRASLTEIESLLKALPEVREARVFKTTGGPNTRDALAAAVEWSEAGRALCLASGKLALVRRIRAALLRSIPALLAPKRWRFTDAFVRNAEGKIRQASVEALFDPPPPRMDSARARRGRVAAAARSALGAPCLVPGPLSRKRDSSGRGPDASRRPGHARVRAPRRAEPHALEREESEVQNDDLPRGNARTSDFSRRRARGPARQVHLDGVRPSRSGPQHGHARLRLGPLKAPPTKAPHASGVRRAAHGAKTRPDHGKFGAASPLGRSTGK